LVPLFYYIGQYNLLISKRVSISVITASFEVQDIHQKLKNEFQLTTSEL
jgi:hypothetical protein